MGAIKGRRWRPEDMKRFAKEWEISFLVGLPVHVGIYLNRPPYMHYRTYIILQGPRPLHLQQCRSIETAFHSASTSPVPQFRPAQTDTDSICNVNRARSCRTALGGVRGSTSTLSQ